MDQFFDKMLILLIENLKTLFPSVADPALVSDLRHIGTYTVFRNIKIITDGKNMPKLVPGVIRLLFNQYRYRYAVHFL